MSDFPKISIVTPSFNQGLFIESTILSVIDQGYPNIEYIVIDGGSTDNTVELIREYEKHLTYWVSERDNGQADAISKGFDLATGEILCWLNSDDTLLPGALQQVADCFAADADCGTVYGRAMYIDEEGSAISEYPTQPYDLRILPIRNFICQPAVFFKRSVYESVGGLDVSLRFSMDYDLWIRIAKVSRFCFLPELLATYRLHTQSKTVDPSESAANHAEGLATTIRHFNWAPISKVYGYCYVLAKNALPGSFCTKKLCCGIMASLQTIFKYLALNGGVNPKDLRVLSFTNLWKFLSGWEDVTVKAALAKENPKGTVGR